MRAGAMKLSMFDHRAPERRTYNLRVGRNAEPNAEPTKSPNRALGW